VDEVATRHVLIVANRTAATPDLLDAVKRHAHEQPTSFTLLIPDEPEAKHPDWTLDVALPLLKEAAGEPVEGLADTSGDPFDVVRNALSAGNYDQVIISTPPHRLSHWLHHDLPGRVEALGVPVEVVTSEHEPQEPQHPEHPTHSHPGIPGGIVPPTTGGP
jgi:hypothetical protein